MNKLTNKRGDIVYDSTEIQRVRRNRSEHLHADRFDDLEDVYKFLETCNY